MEECVVVAASVSNELAAILKVTRKYKHENQAYNYCNQPELLLNGINLFEHM